MGPLGAQPTPQPNRCEVGQGARARAHPPRSEAAASAPSFDVVTTPEAFAALEPEWRTLWARLSHTHYHYSQSFDWARRGWECVARPNGIRIFAVVGRDRGRAALIWPLMVRRHRAWRTAQWLGSGTSEYGDVLVEPGPAAPSWLAQAWSIIRSRSGIDFVRLDHVRPDAAIAALIPEVPGARSSFARAPYLPLHRWCDWDDYRRTRSRSFRSNQSRRRRRLAERGSVSFQLVETPERVAETLEWIFEQKKRALERGRLDAAAWFGSAAVHRRFLEAIVGDARTAGTLALTALTLDGRIIAADLGFRCGDRLESLIATYDPEWAFYSPGRILLEETVQWCFARGVRVFDMRMGDEGYKYDWTSDEVRVGSHLLPCTVWGRAYAAMSDAKRWLEKLRSTRRAG